MPSSPRGVCRLSGHRKRARPYRWPPGRCGHRPLQKTTCVFSVGGDALIAPRGMLPERSERTDTPVPSASGPMWASAPTKNNVRLQRWGRCPHRPVGCVSRAVRKNGHACTASPRADVGIGPYKKTCVFSVGGVTHKNNVCFQRRPTMKSQAESWSEKAVEWVSNE